MNALILILAMLTGPLPESKPSLALKLHVGAGRESDIIRSELNRSDPWFLSHKIAIGTHYRIEIIESLFKSRPQFQIGRGGERIDFPPGSFSASGSFTRTLRSVVDSDRWERDYPDSSYHMLPNGEWAAGRDEATRPEVFPPRPPEPVPPPKDNPEADVIPVPELENPPDVP